MIQKNTEKINKVLGELRDSKEQLVKLVVDLIGFKSENPPVRDHEIQLFIRDYLRDAGLNAELHNPGDEAWALTSSYGENEPGFIFYGHADVVPAGDPSRWKYPPFSGVISDNRIYGRGAGDMKGGLAAELLAYQLLYQSDLELPGKIEFVSVLDEENWHKTPVGWSTSDWLLATNKLTGKACIMGEQSGIGKVCIGERGDYWIRLRCSAKPRHGSAPVFDDNACIKLFQLVNKINVAIGRLKADPPAEVKNVVYDSPKFIAEDLGDAASDLSEQELLDMLTKPTMNVGIVRGGTMINIVPDCCEAEIALCVPIGLTRDILHQTVSKTIEESGGYATLELLGESQSNPSYTSPHAKVVEATRLGAQSVIGSPPALYVTQGTSDANTFRRHGVDTVFYGPGDFANTHGYNESVSIDALIKIAEAYVKTVLHYFDLA
ncbi:MAG: ArgE/DapE family deacylase [Thermoprotei archaeon]